MHTLRYWAVSALVAVTLSVGACTTVSQEQRLQDVCSVYDRTLNTLAGFRESGDLSEGQIDTVNDVRVVMNEVCYGNVSNVQEALERAVNGVEKLMLIRRSVQ